MSRPFVTPITSLQFDHSNAARSHPEQCSAGAAVALFVVQILAVARTEVFISKLLPMLPSKPLDENNLSRSCCARTPLTDASVRCEPISWTRNRLHVGLTLMPVRSFGKYKQMNRYRIRLFYGGYDDERDLLSGKRTKVVETRGEMRSRLDLERQLPEEPIASCKRVRFPAEGV